MMAALQVTKHNSVKTNTLVAPSFRVKLNGCIKVALCSVVHAGISKANTHECSRLIYVIYFTFQHILSACKKLLRTKLFLIKSKSSGVTINAN